MKSGKSYDLISYFAPLKYTTIPYVLYQSQRNVRDEQVTSRNGVALAAQKISDLKEALLGDWRVVGIDETHMFPASTVEIVEELLKRGVKVIVSGLDLDYRGHMFEIVKGLLELGPKEVRYKRAVCEICKNPEAIYTQVLKLGEPIVADLPPVLPDDGTYTYMTTCRHCFIKPGVKALPLEGLQSPLQKVLV
jgi:thymidine kinase